MLLDVGLQLLVGRRLRGDQRGQLHQRPLGPRLFALLHVGLLDLGVRNLHAAAHRALDLAPRQPAAHLVFEPALRVPETAQHLFVAFEREAATFLEGGKRVDLGVQLLVGKRLPTRHVAGREVDHLVAPLQLEQHRYVLQRVSRPLQAPQYLLRVQPAAKLGQHGRSTHYLPLRGQRRIVCDVGGGSARERIDA